MYLWLLTRHEPKNIETIIFEIGMRVKFKIGVQLFVTER